MAGATDWSINGPAFKTAKKEDNGSFHSESNRSYDKSPLEEMADAADRKDVTVIALSSEAKQNSRTNQNESFFISDPSMIYQDSMGALASDRSHAKTSFDKNQAFVSNDGSPDFRSRHGEEDSLPSVNAMVKIVDHIVRDDQPIAVKPNRGPELV